MGMTASRAGLRCLRSQLIGCKALQACCHHKIKAVGQAMDARVGPSNVFLARRLRDKANGPLKHVMHLFSLQLVTLPAACRAWKDNDERPFLLDTVFDLLCLIDYLCTRPDVDPERIGITGRQEGKGEQNSKWPAPHTHAPGAMLCPGMSVGQQEA